MRKKESFVLSILSFKIKFRKIRFSGKNILLRMDALVSCWVVCCCVVSCVYCHIAADSRKQQTMSANKYVIFQENFTINFPSIVYDIFYENYRDQYTIIFRSTDNDRLLLPMPQIDSWPRQLMESACYNFWFGNKRLHLLFYNYVYDWDTIRMVEVLQKPVKLCYRFRLPVHHQLASATQPLAMMTWDSRLKELDLAYFVIKKI